MYEERRAIYGQLEERLDSKVIAYVTGDRRQLETRIASEVMDFFTHHLDAIGVVPKISLILHTRGGDTLAAWSIANLFRSFCDHLEIIVPAKAHSAGTLIALGADSIMMTKQATLGPIDPSVSGPLNPQMPGGQPNNRVPVSVEDINGYLEFAQVALGGQESDLAAAFQFLASEVNPLVLGNAYRARSQIRMLGRRLLENHMSDDQTIETILDFLCSESGSHDYTINRREASGDLGLPVVKPSQELYEVVKAWHDDMSAELELSVAYDPNLLLGASQQATYRLPRALIESANGGTDVFVSEGALTRQQVQIQPGVVGDAVHDQRTFEGWRHYDPA